MLLFAGLVITPWKSALSTCSTFYYKLGSKWEPKKSHLKWLTTVIWTSLSGTLPLTETSHGWRRFLALSPILHVKTGKNFGRHNREIWVLISSLPFASQNVTAMTFTLSEPQFPNLHAGVTQSAKLRRVSAADETTKHCTNVRDPYTFFYGSLNGKFI